MPSLTIRGVRTVIHNGVNATFFHPFLDALALTLDCHASADLLALPSPRFHAQFEILNPSTDIVVVNSGWGNPLAWGQFFWISNGNNWGPPAAFSTPDKWGIHPASHGWNEVFGFRGIIKAYSWEGPSGLSPVDAFDVSPIRWFRVGTTHQ
jgi:hypothetical protein